MRHDLSGPQPIPDKAPSSGAKSSTGSMLSAGRSAALPRIAAVGTALPPDRWAQADTYAYLAERVPAYDQALVKRVFMRAGIDYRHVAFVPDRLDPAPDAGSAIVAFAENATALAAEAGRKALDRAGLTAEEVDLLCVVTSTGYLCPGVAARIAPQLGLRRDAARTEVVGAGCAGALPGLQRGHDYLMAHPQRRALVICVEICSTCLYVDDDLETIVGNAICADGAAAVLLEGAEAARVRGDGAGPAIGHFATASDPECLDRVGFAHRNGNLRIILSKDIPDLAGGLVKDAVTGAAAQAGAGPDGIGTWVVHSGGRRVLDRLSEAMDFDPDVLAVSRDVLRAHGNMSSPTVLFVLAETLDRQMADKSRPGAMVALGPGLVAEAALLYW